MLCAMWARLCLLPNHLCWNPLKLTSAWRWVQVRHYCASSPGMYWPTCGAGRVQVGDAQGHAQAGDDARGRNHARAQAPALLKGLHRDAHAAAAQQHQVGRRLASGRALPVDWVVLH